MKRDDDANPNHSVGERLVAGRRTGWSDCAGSPLAAEEIDRVKMAGGAVDVRLCAVIEPVDDMCVLTLAPREMLTLV